LRIEEFAIPQPGEGSTCSREGYRDQSQRHRECRGTLRSDPIPGVEWVVNTRTPKIFVKGSWNLLREAKLMRSLTRWAARCSSLRCDRSGSGGDRCLSQAGRSARQFQPSRVLSQFLASVRSRLTSRQISEIEDELWRRFETGALKPPPIEIVPFENAVDAYNRVAAKQAKTKQVLSFDWRDGQNGNSEVRKSL
jgi:hypothetical protein